MNTIKSAALLAVLLGVLYGVYVALSKPDFDRMPNSGGETTQPLNIEWGSNGALPPAPSPATYSRGASNSGASYQTYQQSPAAQAERPSSFEPSYEPTANQSPAASAYATSTPNDSGLAQSAYVTPAAPSETPTSTPDSAPPAALPQSEPVSPASAAAAAAPALAAYELKRDLAEADQLVNENKYRSALAKLTPHYASPDLPAEERAVLLSWLDPLAGKVIYSREHLLASPHQVRKGETLYDVAHQYNVEYRLLQNINSKDVSDPLVLVPGTELKVVPGPFRADVNLSTGELTVLVGDLYAGRFPFTLGDQPPQPGEFKVIDKRSQQKSYVGFDGRVIPANDPNNPYGGWWLSLGGEVALHGSPAIPGDQTLGCISLSTQDAKDLYGILSIGSEVKIRR